MKKKGKQRDKRFYRLVCIMLAGMLFGAGLFGAINANAATEKAVADKPWESVEKVLKTKVGEGYNEVGMCTGFLYWALKNAYGVDWGDNSNVKTLEQKLVNAGITKVESGSSGKITSNMKPGDIVIFADGTARPHCAILGEGGKLYHAIMDGVDRSYTLSEWMDLPKEDKNCESYIIYRGLISKGTLTVTKKSAQPEITDGNECYSLIGTQYGLYDGNTLVGTLKINENGKATLTDIPFGKYVLKEISAGTGYAVDRKKYDVVIDKMSVTIDLEDQPQVDRVKQIICKVDEESHMNWNNENRGQYGASLEGAVYDVSYYDGYFNGNTDFEKLEPERSWVIKTDESGQAVLDKENMISGDSLYYSSDGEVIFPLGTIVICEKKAPEGYLLDERKHIVHVTSSGEERYVDTYAVPVHKEKIIKGDVELIKIEDGTMKRLGGVPFTLTSKSTGKVFDMVTDINGYVSTAKENSRGTLPYDTYILDEQPCTSNEGHKLIEGVEISIYKEGQVVDLGTITNDKDIIMLEEPPTEPENPIEHKETDVPIEPEEPTESAVPENKADTEVVDTGDQLPWQMAVAICIMIISGVFISVSVIRRNLTKS